MSTVVDVHTPDGEAHRHVSSMQNGRVEVRTLPGGGVEVIGVKESKEVRAWGGKVVRPAARSEAVLGSYPAGSRVEYVAR